MERWQKEESTVAQLFYIIFHYDSCVIQLFHCNSGGNEIEVPIFKQKHCSFRIWRMFSHPDQNHMGNIIHILRLIQEFSIFSVANKYNAYSVRNSCVSHLFRILMNLSRNSTPFWPKTLFSSSKTGKVIFILHWICTENPYIFCFPSRNIM